MNSKEFIKYIESIGFIYDDFTHRYKEYKIRFNYHDHYDFYNGSEWMINIDLNDLIPIQEYFKQELRSIKLKQLLR